MGELADLILDGLIDEETGKVIDEDALGFPRSMRLDATEQSKLKNQARTAAALPFPCLGCGRSFKHKGDRRAHQRAKSH